MDNTSAVHVVKKMGNMRSHILGVEADEDSRREDHSSERLLNPKVFSFMLERLTFSPEIALFAHRRIGSEGSHRETYYFTLPAFRSEISVVSRTETRLHVLRQF